MGVGVTDDATHLRAQVVYEQRKARWAPYKGDPDRQCTARTRAGQRCKASRAKRPDGTLNTVCRFHGGAALTLEARAKALRSFARLTEARLKGIYSKLALVEDELKRARDMGAGLLIAADSSGPANYSGPIEDAQSNHVLSGARQTEGQTSEEGNPPARSDDVGESGG